MPSKRKKRKIKPPAIKKKKIEVDFEMAFTDRTLVEGDGQYERVKELMKEDIHGFTEWIIKTNLTISSPFGEGFFVLDFYHNRNIYIIEYNGAKDIYSNHDLSCLSRWAQANGWHVPIPSELLIKENLYFWKHMWEVLLVDSDYLDKRYGNRVNVAMRDMNSEEDEYDIA